MGVLPWKAVRGEGINWRGGGERRGGGGLTVQPSESLWPAAPCPLPWALLVLREVFSGSGSRSCAVERRRRSGLGPEAQPAAGSPAAKPASLRACRCAHLVMSLLPHPIGHNDTALHTDLGCAPLPSSTRMQLPRVVPQTSSRPPMARQPPQLLMQPPPAAPVQHPSDA